MEYNSGYHPSPHLHVMLIFLDSDTTRISPCLQGAGISSEGV